MKIGDAIIRYKKNSLNELEMVAVGIITEIIQEPHKFGHKKFIISWSNCDQQIVYKGAFEKFKKNGFYPGETCEVIES